MKKKKTDSTSSDVRHIIPISGKDSLTTAIVQTAREDREYEYVFNPTGLELPEVFEWLDSIEEKLDITIERVGKPLKKIIEGHNYFLPSQGARYCTRQSKIEPMVKWIGDRQAKVYYGIRADENRVGFDNSTSPNITPVYPLSEMGINLQGVYLILNRYGLKPPTFFWEEVYEKVKTKLGYDPKKILPEWIFDMLFSWRSRPNCDRCYNQRYYEWIGLLKHHPKRFWDAESWEHKGGSEYTWSSNQKSLKELSENADRIIEKRVNAIIKAIKKFEQYNLFEDEDRNRTFDVLAVTSCGLLCGK